MAKHEVSTCQIVACVVFFVASVTFVGLMSGLFGRSETTNGDSGGPGIPTIAPTEEPDNCPFQGGFLLESIWPTHYDLWLSPNFYYENDTFRGFETIHIHVRSATDMIVFHYKLLDLQVELLTESGESLPVVINEGCDRKQVWVVKVAKMLEEDARLRLEIAFNGSLSRGIVGFYKSSYFNHVTARQSWMASSKFQPTDARKAFPNFDEPKFKSNFTVTLEHRSDFTALSNMPEESTSGDGDWRNTTFQETPPMSSYLVCFVVFDFIFTENRLHHNIPHRIWSAAHKINETLHASGAARTIADFFFREFQLPFLLPKLDQVAVPSYPSGATEHWGLITYREANLLLDDGGTATAADRQRVTEVVAHELAHNYFGNPVTCRTWDHIWLNEAFANFYEILGIDEFNNREWNMAGQMVTGTVQSVLRADSSAASRPVLSPLDTPDAVNSAFDGITYNKGASLVRMLERLLGKEVFRTRIRAYLRSHLYATVVTEDLWAALWPGDDGLSQMMAPWTLQMGYPVVELAEPAGPGGQGAWLATQRRFMGNRNDDPQLPESPYKYVWPVPLFLSDGDDRPIWINSTEPVKVDKPDVLRKLNPAQSGFYRVNYPPTTWREFSDKLADNSSFLSPVDRSGLVDDAFALAASGALNYSTALEVGEFLRDERDLLAWRSAASGLELISDLLYGDAEYHLWRKHVQDLVNFTLQRVGIKEGDDHMESLLRSQVVLLACRNGHRECLDNCTTFFSAWLRDATLAPPVDVRPSTYRFGVQQVNSAEAFETVWSRYVAETSAQEKRSLLRACAAIRQTWLMNRYLHYVSDPAYVSDQDFFTAVQYLALNNDGLHVAWTWATRNYNETLKRFSIDDRYFGRYIPNIAALFKTEEDLQMVRAFYAEYPEAGAGELPRKQSLDNIRSNIAWLSSNRGAIYDWLGDRTAS